MCCCLWCVISRAGPGRSRVAVGNGKKLLRRIWKDRSQYEGIDTTVVIPSDPEALLDRLDILLASKATGNTGVRNEIVSIYDEILRQNVFSRNHYKKLVLYI